MKEKAILTFMSGVHCAGCKVVIVARGVND